ncbi:MAG: ABC-2 family transporter protein [Lachnospiraceae bacterium]|nr:ABC-2 family transporter protein [Lachnospiraceae bacterium]
MKKKLRVYLPFMENEFKRNLAYKGSFYLFMLCWLFTPFINYYLWMAIYGSSDGSMLGGLTKDEMVVYVFMSYVTTQMVFVSISDYIADHVTEGSVVMNLIKPINYRMSLISQALGTMLYRFFAPTIFVWVGVEIYKAKVLGMGITPLPNILCYIVSVIMSFLIFVLFDFCFGMVAFVTTYMYGMQLIKEALIGFLSGELIPISFFPVVMQRVFDFMPFSSMVYAPVMIYLGKYTGSALMFAMARQLVWVVFLYVLGSVLWNRVTRRLVVLGG